MVDEARIRKLAVRIRRVAADTLERGVKDPRIAGPLALVTVTDARVSGDLREATVFYTVLGDETAHRATAAALESATGVVRSAIGRRTGMKFTPSLRFVADVIPDEARHIEELLDVVRSADAELASVRRDAVPAGDVDPYRDRGE